MNVLSSHCSKAKVGLQHAIIVQNNIKSFQDQCGVVLLNVLFWDQEVQLTSAGTARTRLPSFVGSLHSSAFNRGI